MTTPTLIDSTLLDEVTHQARGSERKRKNFNFHDTDDAATHRLLNAVEPGSYVQPHRHLDAAKDETFVVLRGAFGVVLFDADGRVTQTTLLRADGDTLGINIPSGTFHSLLSFEPGSVFYEAKSGPYRPLSPEEKAAWAPAEADPGAAAYLEKLCALFDPSE